MNMLSRMMSTQARIARQYNIEEHVLWPEYDALCVIDKNVGGSDLLGTRLTRRSDSLLKLLLRDIIDHEQSERAIEHEQGKTT